MLHKAYITLITRYLQLIVNFNISDNPQYYWAAYTQNNITTNTKH